MKDHSIQAKEVFSWEINTGRELTGMFVEGVRTRENENGCLPML